MISESVFKAKLANEKKSGGRGCGPNIICSISLYFMFLLSSEKKDAFSNSKLRKGLPIDFIRITLANLL
eukprot:snap_masked-scaffold_6-processed-gene-11.29-mRNA-1 protein AED:1.00 eAED:1.00 QI:0/0/0/0/1/1/2/0/68